MKTGPQGPLQGNDMDKIITLGELLIDLTQKGADENGNGEFTAYPGGAPANVAVAAARLGADTAFIGKVGDDAFGRTLTDVLSKNKVDTRGMYKCSEHPTTMAIVSVDETGERDFAFYRDPGADTQLTAEEAVAAIDATAGSGRAILHVGSLSLTTSPAREACLEAIRYAKEKGMLISYDPNYRAALWDSEAQAIEAMKSLLPFADILKVADEELPMLTGTTDFEEGSRMLEAYGIPLVMVTLGGKGVIVRCGDIYEHVSGFKVEVADTNGAGDTFLGAVLMQLAKRENGLKDMEWDEIEAMVRYANKAASLTCSRSGAIPAMPYAEEMVL